MFKGVVWAEFKLLAGVVLIICFGPCTCSCAGKVGAYEMDDQGKQLLAEASEVKQGESVTSYCILSEVGQAAKHNFMMVLTRCAVGSRGRGGRGRGTSFYHICVSGVLEFQGDALFSTVSGTARKSWK